MSDQDSTRKLEMETRRVNQRYSQFKCFFLGPSNSLVVAFRVTNEIPCPAMKYFIAASLSSSDCPPVWVAVNILLVSLLSLISPVG